jgi:hypothetical protein
MCPDRLFSNPYLFSTCEEFLTSFYDMKPPKVKVVPLNNVRIKKQRSKERGGKREGYSQGIKKERNKKEKCRIWPYLTKNEPALR